MERKNGIIGSFLFACLFLYSCGAYTSVKTPPAHIGNLKDKALQEAPREAGVVQVYIEDDIFIIEESLKNLPNKDKVVNIVLYEAPFDVALHKISEIIGFNVISDIPQQQKKVNINFQGSLYDFLKALEKSLNLVIEYNQNSLIVKEKAIYSFKVPTYMELVRNIEQSLKSMGAENIAYDPLASRLIFTSNKNTIERIERYIQTLKENLAFVVFNIKVLEVRYSKNKNYGIDWTQLGLVTDLFVNQLIPDLRTSPVDINDFLGGSLIRADNRGFNILYTNSRYSINSFINILESYGKVEALQNLYVSTLAGKSGKIEVVVETPYVKSVGTSQTQTSQVSTIQTDMIKSGFSLEVLPFYERTNKLLTIQLKTEINELLNLINLSAGQFGNITQPEVSKKIVENTIKVQAGQAFVIGGLIYNKVNKNTSGLPLDTPITKTLGDRQEKGELVIIVKPVVYEFIQKQQDIQRAMERKEDIKSIDKQKTEERQRKKGISIKEE